MVLIVPKPDIFCKPFWDNRTSRSGCLKHTRFQTDFILRKQFFVTFTSARKTCFANKTRFALKTKNFSPEITMSKTSFSVAVIPQKRSSQDDYLPKVPCYSRKADRHVTKTHWQVFALSTLTALLTELVSHLTNAKFAWKCGATTGSIVSRSILCENSPVRVNENGYAW